MKKLAPILLIAAAAALGAWLYLGRETVDPNAPLAFVPADTPYVFANLEPAPEAVLAQSRVQMDALGGLYASQFAELRQTPALAKVDDPRLTALLDALEAEFTGMSPVEAIESIGLDLRARAALYGLGALPVLRMELAAPERFGAFIARLEAAVGESLPSAEVDGQSYWTLAPVEWPVGGLLAVVGDHLVLSVAPSVAEPAVLRQILGLDRPARSLAEARGLQSLNRELGYLPYFSGYLDSARVLAVLNSEPSTLETAFLAALGIQERPRLEGVCADEFAALAAIWPRASVGYTHLDAARADGRAVLEARSDIAEALAKLRAPMPGLAAVDADTIAHFGMSLGLAALPEVVNEFADQVAAAPWQCEALAPLNAAFAESRQSLSNPALFMAAPVFHGFHAALSRLAMSDGGQPDLAGVLVIGSDNPASLMALTQSMAPQLAGLDLKPDGVVKPLPALPELPLDAPLHAAMTERTLGLAVGAGEEARLPAALAADPAQQPLLAIGVNARFYEFLADMMLKTLPEPDAAAATDDKGEDAEARAQAAELNASLRRNAELMRTVYSKLFKRVDMRLELSERGIEWVQTMELP